ncbi:hypothetical protein [Bacillus sp. FJAT-29937]|uniref:hypothetical protein n=1 Tax=Bacillus sp. FJAT-29937 TaxID=1720553 RepID=UPI00082E2F5E|nr:hypothetical protein [Bacillus sp. FJAT-29937]
MKKILFAGALALTILGVSSPSVNQDHAGIPTHHEVKPVTELAGIPTHHSAKLITTYEIPTHH